MFSIIHEPPQIWCRLAATDTSFLCSLPGNILIKMFVLCQVLLILDYIQSCTHSHLSPAHYKHRFVLQAIHRLRWRCLGLIAMLRGAHTEVVKRKECITHSLSVHEYAQTVGRWIWSCSPPPTSPFLSACTISKTPKQSCITHFVRHFPTSALDTPLSRQIFRECIQLLNHLGLVARQH